MVGWYTICCGSVLYVMAVKLVSRAMYCMLGRCIVCNGGVLCGRGVYSILWWGTVCYGGILYVVAVYCMLWWCTVWYGDVLWLWRCTVC